MVQQHARIEHGDRDARITGGDVPGRGRRDLVEMPLQGVIRIIRRGRGPDDVVGMGVRHRRVPTQRLQRDERFVLQPLGIVGKCHAAPGHLPLRPRLGRRARLIDPGQHGAARRAGCDLQPLAGGRRPRARHGHTGKALISVAHYHLARDEVVGEPEAACKARTLGLANKELVAGRPRESANLHIVGTVGGRGEALNRTNPRRGVDGYRCRVHGR